jgi:hypothetical protein
VPAAVASVLVAAVIVTARPTEDERGVEDTVKAFLSAVGHDGEQACLLLAREAQARLIRRARETSCARAAETTTVDRELASIPGSFYDFDAIHFGAEHRWARVFDTTGEVIGRAFFPPIYLEQGDGHWVIANLGWLY